MQVTGTYLKLEAARDLLDESRAALVAAQILELPRWQESYTKRLDWLTRYIKALEHKKRPLDLYR